MTERRRFIVKAGGAAATTVAAATIINVLSVIAQPKVQWRMSTTWTPALDLLQGKAQRLAKIVEETSGGRFRIEVFPGGQIMQPFECFDAASKGMIEAFMGAPYYWTAKESAVEWFATIPFGMNPQGMTAWLYQGDGLKLMEETHGTFNLVPRPGGSVPPQMAGAGGTAVLIPGAEIFAALERGVIDAAEWSTPHDDMKLGLHKTARYYYYPGWQEPATINDFGFNKNSYDALPVDLRQTLDHAAAAVHVYGVADFHTKNAIALERLKTEFKGKVEILPLPSPVLRDLKKLATEVIKEESEKTPMARKVHASFTKFQTLVGPWDRVAEGAYHQFVGGTT